MCDFTLSPPPPPILAAILCNAPDQFFSPPPDNYCTVPYLVIVFLSFFLYLFIYFSPVCYYYFFYIIRESLVEFYIFNSLGKNALFRAQYLQYLEIISINPNMVKFKPVSLFSIASSAAEQQIFLCSYKYEETEQKHNDNRRLVTNNRECQPTL